MSIPSPAEPDASSSVSPPEAAQTVWARAIIDTCAAQGVGHVVMSPGSRSTPLVLAALRRPTLRLHTVVDEREAAFFALGLARIEGRAPMLLCTSGSAAGHYLPAVMEASAQRVPLLVLSADRPPELHGGGANQTTDQGHLFGRQVRHFVDLGPASGTRDALAGASRRVVQAVLATADPEPGPVHINVPLRKPLEASEPSAQPTLPIARILRPERRVSAAAIEQLAQALVSAERPMFVAGPAPVAAVDRRGAVATLADACDAPLVADRTSQLAGTLQVPALAALRPDLVVQIGRPPIDAAFERFCTPSLRRVVLTDHGFPDPGSSAQLVVLGDVTRALSELAERVRDAQRPGWRRTWSDAQSAHEGRSSAVLEDFGPTSIASSVMASVPDDGAFFVGNSLVARVVDQTSTPMLAPVVHQRGLSGIDGLVAGAAGVAASGRPTTLLLGDVSLRHGLGGLACARGLPLTVVVLHDGGGRIFERLPVHGALPAESFEAHFATADDGGFEHAAKHAGVAYARVADQAGLEHALDSRSGTPRLIEVRVPAERGRAEQRTLTGAPR